MLRRLVIGGLAAFGAKVLYDRFSSSVPKAKSASRAVVERVGGASDRLKRQATGAAKDVASHTRNASHEISDPASDVADLAQPAVTDGAEQRPRDV